MTFLFFERTDLKLDLIRDFRDTYYGEKKKKNKIIHLKRGGICYDRYQGCSVRTVGFLRHHNSQSAVRFQRRLGIEFTF